MNWSQDLYVEALDFAADYHKGQLEPGHERPYVTHVVKVAMEVMAALPHHPEANANLAVLCALLHDCIEDTPATFDDVKQIFGQDVAHGVQALTKDAALPKEEQMPDSLARILRQPSEIAMVKLADRITNMAAPPYYWTPQKCKAYREEALQILAALGQVSTFLAHRLQSRIDIYPIPG